MSAHKEPSYRKRMGYLAGLLGGMALFASVALVSTNVATFEPIQDRLAEDLQTSLREVIPAAIHDNDLLANIVELGADGQSRNPTIAYRATLDGHATGVAFTVTEAGYSGDITVIMGIAADATILGVRVVSHSETPGLGDNIEASKSDWIYWFTGRSLGDPPPERWAVKKDGGDIDQFSGATITPRAATRAVKRGLEFFAAHRRELLGDDPATTLPTLEQPHD